MVSAASLLFKPWIVSGAERVTLSPPERLFVFRPPSVFEPQHASLVCTIGWTGGDVMLQEGGLGPVMIRSRVDEPWKVHKAIIENVDAGRRIVALGKAHAPYSAAVPYPIDEGVVAALGALDVKEVTVGLVQDVDEKTSDVLDTLPLAKLRLESLILAPDPHGRLVIRGLDRFSGLDCLAIKCDKREPLHLAIAGQCAGIRSLYVWTQRLECDLPPDALGKLTYCRLSVGWVTGIRRFLETTRATRVHLDVVYGLEELGTNTVLSPTIVELLITDSRDLKDVSCIAASKNVRTLKLVGCEFVGRGEEFSRMDEDHPAPGRQSSDPRVGPAEMNAPSDQRQSPQ